MKARSNKFKGLMLLRQWVSEAAKGGHSALLKEVLALLVKLPVTVEGLAASKLGRSVQSLLTHEDGDVKAVAGQLRSSWAALVQKGSEQPSITPAEESPAPPPPLTAADKIRMKREAEEAAAAAATREAQQISARLIASLPKIKRIERSAVPDPGGANPATAGEDASADPPAMPRYSKVKSENDDDAATSATAVSADTTMEEPEDPARYGPGGIRSILSLKVTPDVDPANPRKKRKAVSFAADLVKMKYFNVEDDASMVGDKTKSAKSARESERMEGRLAFRKEIKPTMEWRAPKGTCISQNDAFIPYLLSILSLLHSVRRPLLGTHLDIAIKYDSIASLHLALGPVPP
ncbi:hypothetical protein BC830DRAFT_288793 [Chytriomyces sp. MP71]|nr:hypothetical protein BC830DRAFT_288793 [Chytriomyces sp. MP71]